jgi:rhamnose utilization protein RhaD (predicted bifunctional aldolase and dehydrogenase)
MDHGTRLAVLRALTGWRLYRSGTASTLAEAARSTGSNIHYIAAAGILVVAENSSLLNKVLSGHLSLLAAATETKRLAVLVAAYRSASSADRKAFRNLTDTTLAVQLAQSTPAERVAAARTLGPDVVWDQMVLPLIQEDRRSAPAE